MKMAHVKGGPQALSPPSRGSPPSENWKAHFSFSKSTLPPPLLTPRNNSQAWGKPVLMTIPETLGGSWPAHWRSLDRRKDCLGPDEQGLHDSHQGLQRKLWLIKSVPPAISKLTLLWGSVTQLHWNAIPGLEEGGCDLKNHLFSVESATGSCLSQNQAKFRHSTTDHKAASPPLSLQ